MTAITLCAGEARHRGKCAKRGNVANDYNTGT